MSLADEYRPGRWTPEDISPHQTDLATQLRVPFVNSDYPRWNFVVCVVVDPPVEDVPRHGRGLWSGLVPTDDDVRMIGSYIDEYREHWYRDSFKAMMRDLAPYDIDGGACHGWLKKHLNGGWGYRKRTWERGPQWVPQWNEEPAPLLDVLDRVHSWTDGPSPRWTEWKAAHPEVFAVGACA